ncbi:MAG: DNA translocase FtsK [Candidatus Gracilibacteria bacterium]
MARRKSASQKPLVTQEFGSLIWGWGIGFLVVLLLFIDPSSTLGAAITRYAHILFGKHAFFMMLSILLPVALLLIVGKLRWNIERLVGIIIYLFGVVTFSGILLGSSGAALDYSSQVVRMLGSVPGGFLVFGGILVSLYLSLRISYRRVISHVRSQIFANSPDYREVLGVLRGQRDEDDISEKIETKAKTQKKQAIEQKLEEVRTKIKQEETARIPESKPISHSRESEFIEVPIIKKDERNIKHTPNHADEVSLPGREIDFSGWKLPSITHLKNAPKQAETSPLEIEARSLEIEETLLKFKIDVDMKGSLVGPTVIQYRLAPAEGVKLSRIENLKKDLALALKAKTLRIQAPIPGMGLVGIELPNEKRSVVSLKEVIENSAFQKHPSKLAMALGKNINGEYVITDLARMPHLLIAGQTGSGKSVGMNGFLISLLYKNSPRDLRMIMIDPKRVELDAYNGIPHLLCPVINDSEKALNALKWSVAEMLRRYDILKGAGARNLGEYNEKVSSKHKMEYIVIVIDELADLMMSGNKKEVESNITRIAQMARAVGMHLIVATQRPSVDVITGLIKANIPSRIAFTVASQTDSRTILDRGGAEDLLGYGDMLYYPSGAAESDRVQGVLVTTDEVHDVVREIRLTIDPEMLESLQDSSIVLGDRGNFEGAVSGGNFDEDPKIIESAIELIRKEQKASTSMLQRKLGLGFARAGRIMDILEEMGIVGPADGSKPRQILI